MCFCLLPETQHTRVERALHTPLTGYTLHPALRNPDIKKLRRRFRALGAKKPARAVGLGRGHHPEGLHGHPSQDGPTPRRVRRRRGWRVGAARPERRRGGGREWRRGGRERVRRGQWARGVPPGGSAARRLAPPQLNSTQLNSTQLKYPMCACTAVEGTCRSLLGELRNRPEEPDCAKKLRRPQKSWFLNAG